MNNTIKIFLSVVFASFLSFPSALAANFSSFENKKTIITSKLTITSISPDTEDEKAKLLLHEQCDEIFAKLKSAVADGTLPKWYARGATLAKKYVELRIDYPRRDQVVPGLTKIAQDILGQLPKEINLEIDDEANFSWQTFMDLMVEIVTRKNNADLMAGLKIRPIYDHGYWLLKHNKNVDPLWPGVPDVYPAFIVNETGFLGGPLFSILIAFDVGLYGIPSKTTEITVDNRECTTSGFVQHDFGHIEWMLNNGGSYDSIEGEITKNTMIKSGAFRNLLLKINFTKENIDSIDNKFRERSPLPIDYGSAFSKEVLINLYRIGLDSNTTLTEQEIIDAIYSFRNNNFNYGVIPFLLKHVKNMQEAKEIILRKKAPKTSLLLRMKDWGILTIPADNAYICEFLRLLATLECGGENLLSKVDEMHKLGIFNFNYDAEVYHFYFIKSIIDNLKKLSMAEIQDLLKNEPGILKTFGVKKRHDLIFNQCVKRKNI